MRTETGLAFIFGEAFAFFRQAWWLAMAAALPNLALYVLRRVPMPWNEAENMWIVGAIMALAIVALTYWVIRFIALKHDVSAAVAVDRDSARTFLPYAAVAFALIWLSVPLGSSMGGVTGIGLRLLPEFLYFFAPWAMTAPSGSTVIGPIRSLKLVAPHLAWAIGVLFLLLLLYFLLAALVGILGGLLLPRPLSPFFMDGSSLVGAITRATFEMIWDVSLISATYALALRTGLKVNDASELRAVFE